MQLWDEKSVWIVRQKLKRSCSVVINWVIKFTFSCLLNLLYRPEQVYVVNESFHIKGATWVLWFLFFINHKGFTSGTCEFLLLLRWDMLNVNWSLCLKNRPPGKAYKALSNSTCEDKQLLNELTDPWWEVGLPWHLRQAQISKTTAGFGFLGIWYEIAGILQQFNVCFLLLIIYIS